MMSDYEYYEAFALILKDIVKIGIVTNATNRRLRKMSKKDDLKAFYVHYIHTNGGKRKRMVLCKDLNELNDVVLKLQAKGGVIVKVEDITFN